MPRARRRPTPIEPEPPFVMLPEPEPEPEPEPAVADELGDLDELEDADFTGVTWYLYRGVFEGSATTAARGSYISKGTGPVDLDVIRERFGGGWYVLRVKNADRSYRKTLRFAIEGPPRLTSELPTPPARNGGNDDRAELEAELERLRLDYRIKLMRDRLAGTPPPNPTTTAPDPFVMLDRALNIVKAIAPTSAAASVDPARALEVSLDLIERFESRGGGKDTGWADVARDFVRESLPRVIGFLESRLPPRAAATVPATSTPQLAGNPPAPPRENPRSGPGFVVTLLLEGHRDQLTPEAMADQFESKLTGADLDELLSHDDATVLGALPAFSAELRESGDAAHDAQVRARIDFARATLAKLRSDE